MTARNPIALRALTALLVLAALSGCRAEEQNRVTSFEKGVYQGEADQEISKETREALRERVLRQSF